MGWRVRAVSVASSGGAIPRGDDALDNNEKSVLGGGDISISRGGSTRDATHLSLRAVHGQRPGGGVCQHRVRGVSSRACVVRRAGA
jgi:hypothetical protein